MEVKILITKYILTVLAGGLLFCCASSLGEALTDQDIYSNIQFNFITPGARATAMGGAFIGLADDASAGETNPAGLTVLTTPEVSVELNYKTYEAEWIYANQSRRTSITREEGSEEIEPLPFISMVFPYKRFVFSFYRHEMAHYKASYRTGTDLISIPGTSFRFYPRHASVKLNVAHYGFGAAIQLFENLSFAISPRWSEMKIESHYTLFGYTLEQTDFSEDDIRVGYRIHDDDAGFSLNLGMLWTPNPKFSIGAVYKRAPTFSVIQTEFGPNASFDFDEADFILHLPNVFGFGIALHPTDFLTITHDVVHIRYENLLDEFDVLFQGVSKESFMVENTTEVHLGVEYVLPFKEKLLALRVGFYYEPNHAVRFSGIAETRVDEAVARAQFPGGNGQMHFTSGIGLIVNEHLQVDTAVNFAEKMKQLSISLGYHF